MDRVRRSLLNKPKMERRDEESLPPIHIKKKNRGLLHEKLGISDDKKIPMKKLVKAKNSSSPSLRKQATFAINAKSWHKK